MLKQTHLDDFFKSVASNIYLQNHIRVGEKVKKTLTFLEPDHSKYHSDTMKPFGREKRILANNMKVLTSDESDDSDVFISNGKLILHKSLSKSSPEKKQKSLKKKSLKKKKSDVKQIESSPTKIQRLNTSSETELNEESSDTLHMEKNNGKYDSIPLPSKKATFLMKLNSPKNILKICTEKNTTGLISLTNVDKKAAQTLNEEHNGSEIYNFRDSPQSTKVKKPDKVHLDNKLCEINVNDANISKNCKKTPEPSTSRCRNFENISSVSNDCTLLTGAGSKTLDSYEMSQDEFLSTDFNTDIPINLLENSTNINSSYQSDNCLMISETKSSIPKKSINVISDTILVNKIQITPEKLFLNNAKQLIVATDILNTPKNAMNITTDICEQTESCMVGSLNSDRTPLKNKESLTNISYYNKSHNMSTQTNCQEILKCTPKNESRKIKKEEKDDISINSQGIKKYLQLNETVEKSTASKEENTLQQNENKVINEVRDKNNQRLCENVLNIWNSVLSKKHFVSLFSEESINILQNLFELPLDYKIFCLRLFTRQWKWHNLHALCTKLELKEENSKLGSMLKCLVANKFVDNDYSTEPVTVLLNYLNKTQIKDICFLFKLKTGTAKKIDLINALITNANKQQTLSSLKSSDDILRDRVTSKLGVCVKLSEKLREALQKIHILYSIANPDLESPNDIYYYMNKIYFENTKHPKVKIDSVKLFKDGDEFDKYLKSRILRKEYDEQVQEKEIQTAFILCDEADKQFKITLKDTNQLREDKLKPLYLRRFTVGWVYCSVISSGALNMAKHNPKVICKWLTNLLKQKIYCPNKRGLWYEQLAMVKQRYLNDINGAIEIISTGLKDKTINSISKYELSVRGRKIKKSKISDILYTEFQKDLISEVLSFPTRSFQANIVHDNVTGKKKQFVRSTMHGKEYGSVEETAISYYIEENCYTQGVHCEGSLLTSLFYFLFWDIIYYNYVPNTFISEIQSYPLDLYSGDFYMNRLTKINNRLDDVKNIWDNNALCDFIIEIRHKYADELSVLINFDFGDDDNLRTIVRCIGNKVLAAICERFLKHFRNYRSGLPDLFLWNPAQEKCCFVEVKSEKDKLSTKQILWLDYLRACGVKIEVCHVQDIGSRMTKKPGFKPQTKAD